MPPSKCTGSRNEQSFLRVKVMPILYEIRSIFMLHWICNHVRRRLKKLAQAMFHFTYVTFASFCSMQKCPECTGVIGSKV